MKRRYRFLIGVSAALALVIAAFAWLVATESGARWLFARAQPYLPDALTIGTLSGTITSGLTAESASWNDAATNVAIERVFIDVRILPLLSRRVYVDRLDVTEARVELADGERAADAGGGLPDISLPIDLWILDSSITALEIVRDGSTLEIEAVHLAARMEGSDLEIDRLALDSDLFSLTVEGRLRLARKYRGSANVVWSFTPDREFAGRLQISGDADGYEIDHVLDAPFAIESHGIISLDDSGIMANLRHAWQSFELKIGEQQLVSAGGTLTTVGNLDGIDVMLETSAQTGALPESQISLAGNVDASRLRIDAGSMRNELGVLEVDGEVRWTPEASLDFRVTGIDPARLSDRLSGRVAAAGHVDAAFDGGEPSIALRVDAIDGELNGTSIDGSAEVGWSERTLTVAAAEIAIGDSRFSAAGYLGDTVSIDLEIEINAVERLLADAAGSFVLTLGLEGPRDSPDVRLRASGSDLAWTAYRAARMSIDANIRAQGLTIVDVRAADVSVGNENFDLFEASASGTLARHRVRIFAESAASNVEIGAVGGIEGTGWLGEIATLDVAADRIGRWSTESPGSVAISPDRVELEFLCVVSETTAGRVCAGAAVDPGGETALRLEVDALPVSALPLGLPETTQVEGSIDAQLEARIDGNSINGDGSIAVVDARLSSLIDDEELTVAFTDARADASIRNNVGEISARFELEGNGAGSVELRSDNVLDVNAPVDGRATLTLSDADLFAFMLPALSDPYGVIEGTLSIGGSLAQPEFAGALVLEDGRFAIRNAGIAVVDVSARVEQQSVGRLRLSGSGRSGAGNLTIEGETLIAADTGIRSEVRIQGEDFEILRLPDWQLAASPDIQVVFDDRTAAVTGTLDVPRAAVTVREIPEAAESTSSDTVVHRAGGTEPARTRRISIDIGVSLGEEVRFSGFGLETGLDGALRLRGGTDLPYTGVGRLSLRDGSYTAYGQELEIELGNLIFNGPLDEPQLDVRATRRAGDVTAGILLTGTPARLRSEVFSDPRMSDAEALSYLLTGRSLENATNAGEGDTLNQAAFALGLSGAGSIVSQIRSDLGLDTLSVEGGPSSSRIVAGKRFGERLFVEYGYGLIDQLGELLLRYQLNDRLVLESRTGEVSNLDILYSVRKR